MILPGGVVDPAPVALVFGAELAPGIGGGGQIFCRRNGLGVLLRLGQVYGNIQLAVLRGGLPLHVLGDAVPADVVGVLTELVVPVGGLFGVLGVEGLELRAHLGGPGGETAHQLRVKQVPVDHGIFRQHAAGVGVLQQLLQHGGQLDFSPIFLRVCITVQL